MKLRVANKVAKNAGIRPARLGTILRAGRRLSWGEFCYFGKRVTVFNPGSEIGGTIICDPRTKPTVILCDNGTLQVGGVFRVHQFTESDFQQVFKTCDSKGGLMPCYLFTSLSDSMKTAGFVEDFVDEQTGFSWQRLTVKGKGFIVNQE